MKLEPCPNRTLRRPSCKRRDCPTCGVRWARDWRKVMGLNLEAYGRPVALVTITAPGKWRLPWDHERCRHSAKAKCSGPKGCKVQDRALREWSETLNLRWGWMRRAARQAVDRSGIPAPVILERVWEPQKRGAPHLHLVVPFGTELERDAAQRFADALSRLAPNYDFGRVDRHLSPHTGAEAARYLTSYLTGRTSKKNSIRENISDYRLPRSLIWLTPKLTMVTLVTMRTARRARHLWAAKDGLCPPPVWRDARDGLKAAVAFRRLFRPSEDGDEPPATAAVLQLAAAIDARANELVMIDQGIQRVEVPARFSARYRAELQRLVELVAFGGELPAAA